MQSKEIIKVLGVVLLGWASTLAAADVNEFDLAKIEVYQQDSVSPPTIPIQYLFNAFVDAAPGDAGMILINSDQLIENDPGQWEYVEEFTDPFLFEATYPSTAPYQMNINSGSLGTRIENMGFPAEAYPPVPAFTAESFEGMQGADPYQDLILEWNVPGPDANFVQLSVYDPILDDYIVDFEVPSGNTYTISGALLSPNRTYEVELLFGHVEFGVGNDGSGFGSSATKLVGFVSLTASTISTAASEVFLDAGVFKGVQYEQTSDDTPPGAPSGWGFEGFFDAGPGGMTQGEVLGGTMPATLNESTITPGEWDTDDPSMYFNSKSELDAAFASNTDYTMQISGGSLGTLMQGFNIGPDAYPTPGYLLSPSLSTLRDRDNIDSDITLTWSTPDPGVDYVALSIDRLDQNGGFVGTSFEIIYPASVTEVVIPAGTLNRNVDYELYLTFLNGTVRSGSPAPGFGTNTSIAEGFLADTIVRFTPINTSGKLCADLNGDGILNFFDI
ncbi:MAG: hypothetical protein ACWA5W_07215, partial [Phycisphaerales bacterium]